LAIGAGHDTETFQSETADAHAVLVRITLHPAVVIEAAEILKIIARYGIGTESCHFHEIQNLHPTRRKYYDNP
jgi:phosphoglycerate dehydrogenase-like enzyme